MRFKSNTVPAGYTVYAVAGTHAVSFAIDPGQEKKPGLLGFSVERQDLKNNRRRFMDGFKVFKETCPNPDPAQTVSTEKHPVQSFVWDDFTVDPGEQYEYFFYPVTGTPTNLRRGPAIQLHVNTEPASGPGAHDVFFNRGAASSQAYERKFGNKSPNDPTLTPAQQHARLDWLGRGLDQAMLSFIRSAQPGDALRGCFYEFRYAPVVDEFKRAIDRGVDVKIIIDAKLNLKPEQCPVFEKCGELKTLEDFTHLYQAKNLQKKTDAKPPECFPRCANFQTVLGSQIPDANLIRREANHDHIQHNKFMVLLQGGRTPTAVWTGSTNVSEGGIFGQTNVGHWVKQPEVAQKYLAYWEILSQDPGVARGQKGNTGPGKAANVQYKKDVEKIQGDLVLNGQAVGAAIPQGTTTIFSPRPKETMLETYVKLLGKAQRLGCITLAFGVGADFKDELDKHTANDALTFLLLEKRDAPSATAKQGNGKTFIALTAKNNVYAAWGSYLHSNKLHGWAQETNTEILKLNEHVKYIHSKFLLRDPLSDDPIVVTGSANFSKNSTLDNDENMIIIRGDRRAADIYFAEFMRLFNHYYFRAMQEATAAAKDAPATAGKTSKVGNRFLDTTDAWQAKYAPGSLRAKRIEMFTHMAL